MAKTVAAKRSMSAAGRGASSRRACWVRKIIVMDQRKLARRALGVDTETEAIDQALDFVAF